MYTAHLKAVEEQNQVDIHQALYHQVVNLDQKLGVEVDREGPAQSRQRVPATWRQSIRGGLSRVYGTFTNNRLSVAVTEKAKDALAWANIRDRTDVDTASDSGSFHSVSSSSSDSDTDVTHVRTPRDAVELERSRSVSAVDHQVNPSFTAAPAERIGRIQGIWRRFKLQTRNITRNVGAKLTTLKNKVNGLWNTVKSKLGAFKSKCGELKNKFVNHFKNNRVAGIIARKTLSTFGAIRRLFVRQTA